MRQAYKNGWIMENGHVCALNLGADFCAEHEWGIARLQELCNISFKSTIYGIEKRRVDCPILGNNYLYKSYGDMDILCVDREWRFEYFNPDNYRSRSDELSTYWNENAFLVAAKSRDDKKNLAILHNAFQRNDIAIWLGGGGVFQNAGLHIGIISKISQANKQIMYEADENHDKLMKAADKTGIKQLIDKLNNEWLEAHPREYGAPCSYYALSPRWKKDIKMDRKTAHDVVFWLNPCQQQKNNYGYFTVEELIEWTKGEGPIIMANNK